MSSHDPWGDPLENMELKEAVIGLFYASDAFSDEEEDSSPPPGEPTTPSPTKTPRRSSVREVTPPTTPAAARSPPQAQTRDASATGDSFLQTPAKVVSDALTQFPPQVEGAVANVSQQAGVLSVYTSRAYDKTRKVGTRVLS